MILVLTDDANAATYSIELNLVLRSSSAENSTILARTAGYIVHLARSCLSCSAERLD